MENSFYWQIQYAVLYRPENTCHFIDYNCIFLYILAEKVAICMLGYYHNNVVWCLSSVMQVYCDKTAKARIMQFSLASAPWRNSKGSLHQGLKLGWGGSRLRGAKSRKRCKIELSWQLITNTRWVKKHPTILLSVTSPNVDRFSKFFQLQESMVNLQ